MRSAALACLVSLGCSSSMKSEPPPPRWSPGTVYRPGHTTSRGLLDARGLVHAHSIYSHDACDDRPKTADGAFDQTCLADFRRDACAARHDFIFLTDHGTHFTEGEFPDVLLYRPEAGDQLVLHDGQPTANRMACPDGSSVLLIAGTETGMMPVGLERHLAPPATRSAWYGRTDDEAIAAARAAGAVVLFQHTEDWTVAQLAQRPIDGFEMYNLHASALMNIGVAAELIFGKVELGDFDGLPHPDAFFTAFSLEDERYLSRWGSVLAQGHRRVTTMGTDCHRNTFPQKLQDGERIDSYRRMMIMFSNHLLVKPGDDAAADDRELKAALKARRLFGTFDFLGTPEGFEFVALEGPATKEIGDEVSLRAGVAFEVKTPSVKDLDPNAPAPTITTRLLKARANGWDEVASTTEGTLRFVPTTPGAYRAEVRIVPRHLEPFIGKRRDFLRAARPWVLSNAIDVVP
ncbi:MAG: hypothetical protein INH41_19295 [Myxococcaceae bacterium]|nr:hypothetical protein [Myxococcaceae bacterium]